MSHRWSTPDAAIREVYERPIQRARAIDHAAPRTGSPESAAEALHAQTQVLAVLAQYSREERAVLVGWAFGMSYRSMARAMGCSDWRVRQMHKRVWSQVRDRLVSLGLVATSA